MTDPVVRDRFGTSPANRLDVLVFFLAVVLGAASYFGLQLAKAPQILITTALVSDMCLYSLAVALVPRLRVRLDQAGDNAYYLGLLFTLTSMAFALYKFGEATSGSQSSDVGPSGAEQIISNFGIALATTIAGIFLRVVLHQMRVDPADVESMTRIELAEASKRVKAVLESISMDISRLYSEMQQRVGDLLSAVSEDFRKSAQSISQGSIDATRGILEASGRSQAEILERTESLTRRLADAGEAAREALDRLRSVEPPPTKLATRLEKVSASLERLDQRMDAIAVSFESVGSASSNASEGLVNAGRELTRLALESREGQAALSGRLQASADELNAKMASAGAAIERDTELVASFERQAQRSVDEVERAHLAANEVLENLTEATQELTKLIRRDRSSDG